MARKAVAQSSRIWKSAARPNSLPGQDNQTSAPGQTLFD
jgi:hypothetical protein